MTEAKTPTRRRNTPSEVRHSDPSELVHSGSRDVHRRIDETALLTDLRSLIQSARRRIAVVANATTNMPYWQLGRRLVSDSLQEERAPYGKQILAQMSRELTVEFGQAFTLRSLYRAIQFCQCFPQEEIVSTLSTQLSWSHFIELLPSEGTSGSRFLCRNVQSRTVGCAHAPNQDRRDAVRTHSPVEATRFCHFGRDCEASGRTNDARPCVPRLRRATKTDTGAICDTATCSEPYHD